jgi:hypothetical protein
VCRLRERLKRGWPIYSPVNTGLKPIWGVKLLTKLVKRRKPKLIKRKNPLIITIEQQTNEILDSAKFLQALGNPKKIDYEDRKLFKRECTEQIDACKIICTAFKQLSASVPPKPLPNWLDVLREENSKYETRVSVIEYIRSHAKTKEQVEQLEHLGKVPKYIREGEPYRQSIYEADTEAMAEAVSSSVRQCQRILKALCEMGGIKNLKKQGDSGGTLYSIGWYTNYPRRIYWLNKQKHMKLLKNLDLH